MKEVVSIHELDMYTGICRILDEGMVIQSCTDKSRTFTLFGVQFSVYEEWENKLKKLGCSKIRTKTILGRGSGKNKFCKIDFSFVPSLDEAGS